MASLALIDVVDLLQADDHLQVGGVITFRTDIAHDGEMHHLCPVALIAMGVDSETAEPPEQLRNIHDDAAERVHKALRRSPLSGDMENCPPGDTKKLIPSSKEESGR